MMNLVLIETLWNVKTDPVIDKSLSINVLIETLWNVKIYPHPQSGRGEYLY